jgi:DNA-binding CsgD family transcriptional regulator
MAVLQLMGGGLSTRAIAGNMRISIKTVQTYYAHIKRKMGLSSVPDIIRHAVHWTGPAGEQKPARRRRSRRK